MAHSSAQNKGHLRHPLAPLPSPSCLQVCTVDHIKGGTVRLDATVIYSDECEFDPNAPADQV